MKYKFFIFLVSNNTSTGLATFFPVFIHETNEFLKFDTYDNAEKWIEEARRLEDRNVYQIQKLYL